MLANLAVGFLESSSIAKGIEASDAMVKMASVKLAKTAIVARGKYIILINGPVGEVESAMRAGKAVLDKALVDEVLIRNVASQVVDSLDKRRPVEVLVELGQVRRREVERRLAVNDGVAQLRVLSRLGVGTQHDRLSRELDHARLLRSLAPGLAALAAGDLGPEFPSVLEFSGRQVEVLQTLDLRRLLLRRLGVLAFHFFIRRS
jgi:microcompartment protein CcmL/EutN